MPNIITWYPGDGSSSIVLSSSPHKLLFGESGYLLPSTAQISERVPLLDGDRFQSQNYLPRVFDIPLVISDDTRTLFLSGLRSLVQKLNPNLGEGRLRYQLDDGVTREIYCRYVGGVQGKSGDGNSMPTWEKIFLTFKANDPFWWDISQTSVQYIITDDPITFFPIFPMVLSSGSIFMSDTINNVGDVDCWPIFVIQGPGDFPGLRNMTSGKSINFSNTLGEDETITIDTRPGYKTILKNDGTNLFQYISEASSLWPLLPGNNDIQLSMTAATTDSYLNVAYTPRYLSH